MRKKLSIPQQQNISSQFNSQPSTPVSMAYQIQNMPLIQINASPKQSSLELSLKDLQTLPSKDMGLTNAKIMDARQQSNPFAKSTVGAINPNFLGPNPNSNYLLQYSSQTILPSLGNFRGAADNQAQMIKDSKSFTSPLFSKHKAQSVMNNNQKQRNASLPPNILLSPQQVTNNSSMQNLKRHADEIKNRFKSQHPFISTRINQIKKLNDFVKKEIQGLRYKPIGKDAILEENLTTLQTDQSIDYPQQAMKEKSFNEGKLRKQKSFDKITSQPKFKGEFILDSHQFREKKKMQPENAILHQDNEQSQSPGYFLTQISFRQKSPEEKSKERQPPQQQLNTSKGFQDTLIMSDNSAREYGSAASDNNLKEEQAFRVSFKPQQLKLKQDSQFLKASYSQSSILDKIKVQPVSEVQRLRELSTQLQSQLQNESIGLMTVNKMKNSLIGQLQLFSKQSRKVQIEGCENIQKLINNPFLEMMDIKCEFHQIIKALQASKDIDLNCGQWIQTLEYEARQLQIDLSSIEISGCFQTPTGSFRKIAPVQVPFRLLPFLYFLKIDDLQEVIMQSIEVDDLENVFINVDRMYEDLKGYSPILERDEVLEIFAKLINVNLNGKSTYALKISMPTVRYEENGNSSYVQKLSIYQVYDLIYNYKLDKWKEFIHDIINQKNSKLTPTSSKSNKDQFNELIHQLKKQQTFQLSKYISPNQTYTIFLKSMQIQFFQLGISENLTLTTFDVPFQHTKTILQFLKSKSNRQSELISKLIQVCEFSQDTQKQIFRVAINLEKLHIKRPTKVLNKSKLQGYSPLADQQQHQQGEMMTIPTLMLDGHMKVKLAVKNPSIKFASCKKEENIVQREIQLQELVRVYENNFENWEQSIVNVSRLM